MNTGGTGDDALTAAALAALEAAVQRTSDAAAAAAAAPALFVAPPSPGAPNGGGGGGGGAAGGGVALVAGSAAPLWLRGTLGERAGLLVDPEALRSQAAQHAFGPGLGNGRSNKRSEAHKLKPLFSES